MTPGAVIADMIRITAPHFTAGLIFQNDVVVTAAPILHYMRGWSRKQVEEYCVRKRWVYLIRWGSR
jgi:hypothetical protein